MSENRRELLHQLADQIADALDWIEQQRSRQTRDKPHKPTYKPTDLDKQLAAKLLKQTG